MPSAAPLRAVWRLTVAAALLAGVAVAIVSIRTAPETYPVADTATTSIYVLRAGRGELAVGSYSRFGWNHPGPLLYQVLAGPYLASGRREIALKWTALALNLGWIAGLLAVAGRRSPRLAVGIAVALIPLLWREQRLLIFPWNPLAPVLALPFAIALAADLDARRWWTPALLVVLLSFCVQAHVGLALPALAVVAAAGLVLAARHRRGDAPAWPTLSSLAFAALAALAVWAVPLLDEARHGNLGAIARTFLDGTQAHPAWGRAIDAAAYMFLGPFLPQWQVTTGEIPRDLPVWQSGLAALLLAGVIFAGIRAARRGDRYEAAFAAICAAATVAVAVAARGIVGPMSDYLLLWAAAVGALDAAIVLSAIVAPATGSRAAAARGPLVAVCLVCWAAVGAWRLTSKHTEQARDPTVRALAVDLQQYAHTRGLGRPVLAYAPDAWQEAAGIVLQFDKADLPFAVADEAVYLVGPSFARSGREAATYYLMPVTGTLPSDAGTTEWVTTRGVYRIVRLRATGNAAGSSLSQD